MRERDREREGGGGGVQKKFYDLKMKHILFVITDKESYESFAWKTYLINLNWIKQFYVLLDYCEKQIITKHILILMFSICIPGI